MFELSQSLILKWYIMSYIPFYGIVMEPCYN